MSDYKSYLGNPHLKKIGIAVSITQEQEDDYIKCAADPVYFIEKYVKFVVLDKGFTNVKLHQFQKEAVDKFNADRKIIMKIGRQFGKTTVVVGYILWYILFNSEKSVAILANKAATSREILDRVKNAYEALPLWIQQGVKEWNKGRIELENKCRVMATSTSSSAIRGYSMDLIYLDEFAFVPANIAEAFFTSVFPTISSGTTSKIIVTSTPNGMNYFYKMWTEAIKTQNGEEGGNGFVPVEVNWRDIPGRTQDWADEMRRTLGEQKYMQEVECEFLGSVGTLISAMVLKNMSFDTPMIVTPKIPGLNMYEPPDKGCKYLVVADTARGKGLDYSAFVIFDVTKVPYRQVCTYKDNDISPLVYSTVIRRLAVEYNNAYVLVEINDNGQQVADSIFEDYDYENMIYTIKDKQRVVATEGGGPKSTRGVMTTKSVKRMGCANLKNIVENYNLIIRDFETIKELSTFIAKKGSYEAEEGSNDDLVMCHVLFAWLTNQTIFKDLYNDAVRAALYAKQMSEIESQDLPDPIFHSNDALKGDSYVEGGAVWEVITNDYYPGSWKNSES